MRNGTDQKMKKIALIALVAVLAIVVVVVKVTRKNVEVEPVCWYGMMPHPYVTEVRSGVERFEQETGLQAAKVVGQQWTQDNENVNIEALSTKGYKAFSIYPGDPAGANALFAQLKGRGQLVVAYGAEPDLPTPVPFTVATDIKAAAMTAAEKLIELMGGRGRILNVLEMVTDINTRKRDEGIQEVVARHPGVEIIQTISDMSQVSEAVSEMPSAASRYGILATEAAAAWMPWLSRPCIGLAPGANGSPCFRPSGVSPVAFPYTTLDVIVRIDWVWSASR